jgi:hypothetical protein
VLCVGVGQRAAVSPHHYANLNHKPLLEPLVLCVSSVLDLLFCVLGSARCSSNSGDPSLQILNPGISLSREPRASGATRIAAVESLSARRTDLSASRCCASLALWVDRNRSSALPRRIDAWVAASATDSTTKLRRTSRDAEVTEMASVPLQPGAVAPSERSALPHVRWPSGLVASSLRS